MTTWIWIAIIALVIYMMFRRKKAQESTGTIEPQEAPHEEKVIAPEEIAQAEVEHAEITAEEDEKTKAA